MGRTVVINGKKIKLSPETEDPSTLEAGIIWFRSDTGELRFSPDGSNVKVVHPPAWGDISGKPSAYPPESHTHDASDITSGRLSLDRLPSGTAGYVLEAQGSGSSPAWVNPNGRYAPAPHDHSGDTLKPAKIEVGDIKFANGWVLTEDDKYGLVLKSPTGKRYRLQLTPID